MNLRFASLQLLAALALLPPLAAHGAQAGESAIYVSPSGNDAWSGSLAEPNEQKTDGPLATLEKARDLVRSESPVGREPRRSESNSAAAPISSSQPLVLAPEDSGTQQAPIVWSAYGKSSRR